MGRAFALRSVRFAVLGAVGLAFALACSSLSEEGESCDRANGNADCENGLICRGEWEVAANEAVCCPRPPAKPSSGACKPELDHHVPDPSIDGSYGAGGAGGTGGAGGSAGSGGTGDSGSDADAAEDASSDGASDASGDGAAGAAGNSGLDAAGG